MNDFYSLRHALPSPRTAHSSTSITKKNTRAARSSKPAAHQTQDGRPVAITTTVHTIGADTTAKSSQCFSDMGLFYSRGKRLCKRCVVCGCGPRHQRFDVDHNHHTLEIRGLLCRNCNLAVGHVKESPSVAKSLVKYVEGLV